MLEICIFIGIIVVIVLFFKKCWIFIREDVRNLVLKFFIWYCRNLFFFVSKECIIVLGLFLNFRVILGEDLEWIIVLWFEFIKKNIKIIICSIN